MVVFLLQMCVVQAALWTGLITNNQWIDYPALKLSWRQKNSNFFSFPLLGYLPHSEHIHKICLIDSEKVCTYGDIIISLRVPTDQHCTVQNVGRSILWNKIKISHICKFVSWRLTRHSHVRSLLVFRSSQLTGCIITVPLRSLGHLHMGGFCSFMEPHRDEQWVIWCKPSGVMFSKTWVHQPAAKTRRCVPSTAPSNLNESFSSALCGVLNLTVKNKLSRSAVFRLL